MSATPNSAGAGWESPPARSEPLKPPSQEAGRNALQALLAFACIHEQARRRRTSGVVPHQENQFALDEVLQLVAERALSITGADGIAIALANQAAIVCRATAGKIVPDRGARLDPSAWFSGACLRSGQTVRCDDSESDPRVNAEACRRLGARSMIAVPLSAKQRVIGLVEGFSSEAFGFNDGDVRSLNLLGELILAAIRPEEEDRLAELAARAIPAAPVNSAPKILVDEKFAPAPVRPLLSKPEISRATNNGSTASGEVQAERTGVATPAAPLAQRKSAPLRQNDETKPPESVEASGGPATAATGIEEADAQPAAPVPAFAISQPERWKPGYGAALTAALLLVAVGVPWILWPKLRHTEHISANTGAQSGAQPGPHSPMESSGSAAEDAGSSGQSQPTLKPGATPQVTGIRHWSANDASTVVVELDDQVQYEAHSLENPARIYFDLHDTKMAPAVLNQVIDVNDSFVKRVRIAQPVEGITRVVLEVRENAEPSVSLDPNPYRLTIRVHKPTGQSIPAPVLSLPGLGKPSPALPSKKPSSSNREFTSPEFQVVLDAGHGGWDLGAVGKKGLLEKDLVLDVVQRLGGLLEEKLGARVIYTRQDDSYLPLEKRAEIANIARADLFLSVHANYSDLATARGVETFYTNTYSSIRARVADDSALLKQVNWTGVDIRAKVTDSHRLAGYVQQSLVSMLAARNPEVRNRGVKEEQYVVLTGTQMPAVLAEISFVSSPADEDRLQSADYRQQIAEALYKGIAKYRVESARSN